MIDYRILLEMDKLGVFSASSNKIRIQSIFRTELAKRYCDAGRLFYLRVRIATQDVVDAGSLEYVKQALVTRAQPLFSPQELLMTEVEQVGAAEC